MLLVWDVGFFIIGIIMIPSIDMILAEKFYTLYCEKVGGVAFNGDPLPSWQDFIADSSKKKQSDAWCAVGELVANLLEDPSSIK